MLCRHLALIPALALALGVQAREQSASHGEAGSRADASVRAQQPAQDAGARTTRSAPDSDITATDQVNRQKRRDVLRETLRTSLEESRATARQMSLQEKTELRQQLRQQQEWLK